ncbi:MAG TPA: Ti-type conjugative transfer relaxase TraA, partial [Novosphingobium sp.]|nr:Ti-type conjugative transfer relaxase TraA [Novosphingobium sp.]
TPGMDSHGAYVAMSRHRDGLALHYGRDDFADQSKLVRTLSRERGKDMASDYKPEQHPSTELRRAFAERRGITFRERIVEIARQLPERAKSIFAGFRPQANRLEPLPTDQAGLSDQRRAVERYVRAANDIGQMREQGLPVLPHQRDALEKAGKALDAIRPHAAADLASALQRQPSLAREAADGRSQGAIRAMQLEAEIRADPAQRADRFVSDWQRLGQARQAMQRDGDTKGAQRLTNRMTDMAKGLERDAQVESLLRSRTRELGIKTELGRDLARDLAASISMERSRSIGMGL